MSQGMSVDDFLRHSAKSSGKKQYLRDWAGERPYEIVIWLHTLAPITALWRHNFKEVVVREDKETRRATREIWQSRLVCYEDEETLKSQFWRNKETGERDYPPRLCPICKLIENVRGRVAAGKLSWVSPVFAFKGTDSRKDVTLHAGGLYNAFGAKDLAKEDKEQMAAVSPEKGGPIYARDAWKQALTAKLEYMFVVVDNDDPAKGPQIAIESNLLGAKVQNVIAHAVKSLGDPKLGNPVHNPYAIQWTHNPADGIGFDKRYDACRMERVRPSPAVEKMIRESEVPDTSQITARFNPRTVMARMQTHALVEFPWDDLFADAIKAWDADARKRDHDTEQGAQDRHPVMGDGSDRGRYAETRVSAPVPQPPKDEELFGCDDCGKPMKASDPTCPHCGKVYEVVSAAPPAPVLPKRSEARRNLMPGGVIPPAPVPAPAAVSQPSAGSGGGYAGDPDDDIPF